MAKKMETSKKLVYISDFVAICLSAAVIYGTFVTEKDISPLAQVAVASITECGVAKRFLLLENRKMKTGTNMLSS